MVEFCRKMATGGELKLTNQQIVKLAAALSVGDVKTIAEGYLGITPETISNLEYENRNNAQAFNRAIIRQWAYKPENSGPDQVQVSRIFIAVCTYRYVITVGLCGNYDAVYYSRFAARILANPRQYNVTLLCYPMLQLYCLQTFNICIIPESDHYGFV